MNPTHDTLEASYDFCRRLSRRAGSSFYAGFLLLPREKRRAMDALYAFMRHTDDLADDPAPVDLRREALMAWQTELECSLGDNKSPVPLGKGQVEIVGNERQEMRNNEPLVPPSAFRPLPARPVLTVTLSQENWGSEILPAVADTVQKYAIPHQHLYAVIEGVVMDLEGRRYETFDELQTYCEHVASAVGLACIHIWGFRGQEAFEPARQAGIALQLTNILRDLKEDAEQGRVYLPTEDLRASGYTIENLRLGRSNESFDRLMRLEIERAEQFYRGGSELFELLEPDGQRIFGLMMETYWALLRKIVKQPRKILGQRIRLGIPKRMQLAARWALLSPRRLALQLARVTTK